VMSTPAYVDSETITQADGAQISRVPVPLPDDPFVAVRQAQLVDTDTKSDQEEAPLEVMSTPACVDSETITQLMELRSLECSSYYLMTLMYRLGRHISSYSTASLSPNHPLTHVLPTPTPTRVSFHCKTARIAVRTQPTLSSGMSARIAKAAALSPSSFRKRYRSSYETPSPSSPVRENHDLIRQVTDERRERLELTDRVARMERGQESGEE
nr:hypothetical protein [Tanacetum cinerariifolium]